MMKIYCDRCGEGIVGVPLKMLPTACQNIPADALDELLLLKEPLRHKVFCKECIAEIADFALDKNACDECVEQIIKPFVGQMHISVGIDFAQGQDFSPAYGETERKRGAMCEDKKTILKRLKLLLMTTRAGCDIDDLQLSEDETIVTVRFCNGHTRDVCVEADSGIAMIMDVARSLS